MRILITGPTSFTGVFFIEALAKAGHEVHATSTQQISSYTGVRGLRAQKVKEYATVHESIQFGDDAFLALLESESFDVYCHHGAWTKDYRGMGYDFETAFASNTRSVNQVCRKLAANGCRKIIVSGSIFEEAEPVFSPYGLVKKLTSDTIQFYGQHFGMHVSKFVIPNPFGPLDNPKILDVLGREWLAERVARLHVPPYIRDNIPVTLLALGFAEWVEKCSETVGTSSFRPSGYISTMSNFVRRVAIEFSLRLNLECQVVMATQQDFSQPMTLINDMPLQARFPDWDENHFWDDIVQHQISLQSS